MFLCFSSTFAVVIKKKINKITTVMELMAFLNNSFIAAFGLDFLL